ncbi:OLC1v1008471C1 [Oldenlandia corymbosa var. corymbosa]|uniref:OLC1v1008471C1 n=1 Tax=Oldenlandia corymbosa var. corymbosa TaxID=529605 RepID=A0AAV1DLN6_OLDCO|nr:OLC1v1008471C1 [Oldenlandia corymbosa var. corymbosa]
MNALLRAYFSALLPRASSIVVRGVYCGHSAAPSWKTNFQYVDNSATNSKFRFTGICCQCSSTKNSNKKKPSKAKPTPVMKDDKEAFFVVRKGDIVGVYKSLSDCQAQVGNSICDPPVSVFKGHAMRKDAEKHLQSCGLKNALYTVKAEDLMEGIFGTLMPCPYQLPSSVGETSTEIVSRKRSHEALGYASGRSCTVEFDGASKGNPGQAGAGVVLRADDGSLAMKLREGLGTATCNAAEYRAIILGLRYALEKGFTNIRVQGDSKLVCMQIQGLWKVKNQNISLLYEEANKLKDQFSSFQIIHVLRDLNSEADQQANLAVNLAAGHGNVEVTEVRDFAGEKVEMKRLIDANFDRDVRKKIRRFEEDYYGRKDQGQSASVQFVGEKRGHIVSPKKEGKNLLPRPSVRETPRLVTPRVDETRTPVILGLDPRLEAILRQQEISQSPFAEHIRICTKPDNFRLPEDIKLSRLWDIVEKEVRKEESLQRAREAFQEDRKEKKPEERRSTTNAPKYEAKLTPLIKTRKEILEIHKGEFRTPSRTKNIGSSEEWCHYHQGKGHDTEDCRDLQQQIKDGLKARKFQQYVKKSGGGNADFKGRRNQKWKKNDAKNQPAKAEVEATDKAEDEVHAQKILAAPVGAIFGACLVVQSMSRLKRDARPRPPGEDVGKRLKVSEEITFSDQDVVLNTAEGADALVIEANIANHVVRCVYVDKGSSVDIMYCDCFQKLGLDRAMLRLAPTPLVGFSNHVILPLRVVTLAVAIGTQPRLKTVMCDFAVVEVIAPFNLILGRPWMCKTKAIYSPYHLVMKFPTPARIGEVRGNSQIAKQCMVVAMKRGKKLLLKASEVNMIHELTP